MEIRFGPSSKPMVYKTAEELRRAMEEETEKTQNDSTQGATKEELEQAKKALQLETEKAQLDALKETAKKIYIEKAIANAVEEGLEEFGADTSKSQTVRQPAKEPDYSPVEQWSPSGNQNAEKSFQQLTNKYNEVKQYILTHFSGAEQITRLSKLESALEGALLKFTGNFEDLFTFLSKFGQGKMAGMIPSGLKQSIVPERESVNRVQKYGYADGSRMYGKNAAKTGVESSASKGIKNSAYQKQPYTNVIPLENYRQNSFGRGTLLFSPRDLVLAQKFIQNIIGLEMAAPESRAISANEELLGVTMAVMSLKTEVFSTQSGVVQELCTSLKSAVDEFMYQIFYDVNQLLKMRACKEPEDEAGYEPIDKKAVLKIYNYIMEEYKKTGNFKEALRNGIRHAMEVFDKKVHDPNFYDCYRYSETSGFWDHLYGAKGEGKRNGYQMLKQDWNQFIHHMGMNGRDLELHATMYQAGFLASLMGRGTATEWFSFGKASFEMAAFWCAASAVLLLIAYLTGWLSNSATGLVLGGILCGIFGLTLLFLIGILTSRQK